MTICGHFSDYLSVCPCVCPPLTTAAVSVPPPSDLVQEAASKGLALVYCVRH